MKIKHIMKNTDTSESAQINQMAALHPEETTESIKNTSFYGYPEDRPHGPFRQNEKTVIATENATVIQAAFEHQNENTCILNYASSFETPDAALKNKTVTTEKTLFLCSNLYNVLCHFENSYYYWNRTHDQKSCNRIIYTPGILFQYKNATSRFNVLSTHIAGKTDNIRMSELEKNIEMINRVAACHHTDTLIIPQFGLTSDKQTQTAIINRIIYAAAGNRYVKKVIFAIPDKNRYDDIRTIIAQNINAA